MGNIYGVFHWALPKAFGRENLPKRVPLVPVLSGRGFCAVPLGSRRFWEALRKRVFAFRQTGTVDGRKKQTTLQSTH